MKKDRLLTELRERLAEKDAHIEVLRWQLEARTREVEQLHVLLLQQAQLLAPREFPAEVGPTAGGATARPEQPGKPWWRLRR